MRRKKVKIAIAYDFDGTLAPGYMQHHAFLPEIGQKPEKFWEKAKRWAKDQDGDEILAYMHLMLDEARHHELTRKAFRQRGKNLTLFPGVKEWFNRKNQYSSNL